jgi:cytochrome c-type biogenesis protein CcmH
MVRRLAILAACAVILAMAAVPAVAVLPDEVLADPALEARARALSQELRCLVCQNQSIDDSNAPLARDLRVIVRERLSAGDSDEDVFNYLVARYGNYVLLKPPFQADTLILWIGPALVLLIAGAVFLAYIRRRPTADTDAPTPLTDDERRQLAEIIEDR